MGVTEPLAVWKTGAIVPVTRAWRKWFLPQNYRFRTINLRDFHGIVRAITRGGASTIRGTGKCRGWVHGVTAQLLGSAEPTGSWIARLVQRAVKRINICNVLE
jgi:hypothetical protein